MNRTSAASLSIAALSLALLVPASAQTANQPGDQTGNTQTQNSTMQGSQNGNMQGSQNGDMQNSQDMNMHRGRREAMRMVRARATLNHSLNADNTKPGSDFSATLAHKVQLDNGPELPSGTILMGKIVTDDMNEAGTSKLALRFTRAHLKDGQVLPIKATIVGVYSPSSAATEDAETDYPEANDTVPNTWNDGTLQVDQLGVMSGVDLHSKISSMNSGVFVSTRKDNVKLVSGSELELAIAAGHHDHHMNDMSGNNMGGMNGNNCNQ